jgi:hypothetical protein
MLITGLWEVTTEILNETSYKNLNKIIQVSLRFLESIVRFFKVAGIITTLCIYSSSSSGSTLTDK